MKNNPHPLEQWIRDYIDQMKTHGYSHGSIETHSGVLKHFLSKRSGGKKFGIDSFNFLVNNLISQE